MIRVNDVQVRGTHNSYVPPLPPLERQLDEGVRQVEIDAWPQPGGQFAVYHSEQDKRSTCPTLEVCLAPVRAWLEAHPRALPVYLIIENKGAPAAPAMETAVRTALPGRLLVNPREVVGGKWPTLAASRGRAIAVLIGAGADVYSASSPMFVYESTGPHAAITSRPDPIAEAADIAAFVRVGLVVRTQADGDNLLLDQKRRDAAAASGAQIVSARDDGYLLPGGVSFRCDPMVQSPCRPQDLEHTPTS